MQGPAGPNLINITKIYKQTDPVVQSAIAPSGLFVANSTAPCLAGDVVLSGGYRVNTLPPNSGILAEVSTATEPTSTKDGWTTEIGARSVFTLISIAECFDNP